MTLKPEQTGSSADACCFPMLGLTLLALIIESSTLWALDKGVMSVWIGVGIHLIVSLLFAGLAVGCRVSARSWRLAAFALPVVFVLGPIGALGMFLSTLLYARYRRKATPFEVWYRELIPDYITSPEERLIERLTIWGEEADIQHQVPMPFADVLAAGNRAEKQSAIALMLRKYSPSFAPAFREALNDRDNAVRVQAASAITRLEEKYLAENLVLERRRAIAPNDTENLARLAKHYDEHATAALGDEETLFEYRKKAEQVYRQLHELQPEYPEVLWSLGRLMVRAGQLDKAAVSFERALELSGDVADPLQRVWYWECLYNQQRYSELRNQIQDHHDQIPRNSVLPQNLIDSIDLWIDEGALQNQVAV